MDIRPVDLPLLRDETAEFVLRSGPDVYEKAIREGRQHCKPLASPTRGAAALTGAEVKRLKDAELFYVRSGMVELAIAAGLVLPEFSLMPEDLPSPSGLIYFEKPLAAVDYSQWYEREGTTPIVAASWSHWDFGGPAWARGGCWITWYGDAAAIRDNAIDLGILNTKQAGAGLVSRLAIDNESQCPFSPDPIPHEGSSDNSIAGWLASLKAVWLLMGQTLASVEDAKYDRASRRRIEKLGKEPPRVRVITLRRHAAASSGDSDREWHHQWVVRGHWRQQWLPSRAVHRPTWIAPHIKGPEGAPMLGGEKVYALKR